MSRFSLGRYKSFNPKLCGALLNGESIYSIAEAKIVIKIWR